MKVVCRVSAQLLHMDLSANNTKVSFRCPRSLFTQYFLLLLVHIIKLHWQTFSPEPEGLRKCPSVYWCQKKDKKDRCLRFWSIVQQQVLVEFDSRTSQQPGNAIQKPRQGFCHCILYLFMKERNRLKSSTSWTLDGKAFTWSNIKQLPSRG